MALDCNENQIFDKYIGADVLLPYGNKQITGKVVSRKRDIDGSLKGERNSSPLFDTRVYIIEFPDGLEAEYIANIMAENMYAQCNADGEQ